MTDEQLKLFRQGAPPWDILMAGKTKNGGEMMNNEEKFQQLCFESCSYIEYSCGVLYLDGSFTAADLQIIVDYMREQEEKEDR